MASDACIDSEVATAFINRANRALSHGSNSLPNPGPFSQPTSSPPLIPAPPTTPTSNPESRIMSPITLSVPEEHPSALEVNKKKEEDEHKGIHTGLVERLKGLSIATSSDNGFTEEEMKILRKTVPKEPENVCYEIRHVAGKGYGCFAIADIKRGTRILADDPLLVVPLHEYYLKDIQAEFDKLSSADRATYFTLHSAHGQDPDKWPKHIHSGVQQEDRCRIEEQHAARTGDKPTIISIFQTNCMEMGKGAAVFPNAARFNHSCNPNACFTWNPAIKKETIHAMQDIKQGEQITIAYCDATLDRRIRRWQLNHYGFSCDCEACSGDFDDPSSFASHSEERRIRLTELNDDFRLTRGPFIEQGVRKDGFVAQLLEYAKLLNEEGEYTARLADVYLDLTLASEWAGDFASARICARKALQVKIDCQGRDYPDTKKYVGLVKRIEKKAAEAGFN